MDAKQLIAIRAKARRIWVDLEPRGKRVAVEALSPKSAAALSRSASGKSIVEQSIVFAESQARDWEGFTEADIITSGASDDVDFDAALWADLLAEPKHMAWARSVFEKLQERFAEDLKAAEQDAKN